MVASCICVIPCKKPANIANYSVASQSVVVNVQIHVYRCTAGCYHGVCSRRFDKRKSISAISLAVKRSQVSHAFNKSPFPPSRVAAGDLGVCCLIAATAWEMLPRQVEGSQTLLLFMRRLNPVSIYLPAYRRISAERKGPCFWPSP